MYFYIVKNSILHKSFSMILAFLVLFSTVSFTIEKHYCGDTLIDASVFSESKKCGMESMEMLEKKTCCKDEVDVVKGQDELKFSSFEELDFSQQQFIVVYTSYIYNNLFEGLPQQIIPHKDYAPPNLVDDIQLLDAVFII